MCKTETMDLKMCRDEYMCIAKYSGTSTKYTCVQSQPQRYYIFSSL